MGPQLTIRNLTPTLITLTRLETFEDPNSKQSKSIAFLTAPKLGEHAQSFSHEEMEVRLAPFESLTLGARGTATDSEKRKTDELASTTLRITIETLEGERFRIDTNPSYTQKASKPLIPLTPNPSTKFNGLYHPSTDRSAAATAHLTIHTLYPSTHYASWMTSLPSTLPLSALSIPGTHNAHTHYRALPSVRCQVVDIKTQLENGIRFLDIRVQPSHASDKTKKDLHLVHGAFPISLTGVKYLSPVLETCYKFLDQNPGETILISLKREGVGSATDEHLAHILQTHYIEPHKEKWYTAPTLPYIGSARGKIVLVRRYKIIKPSSSSSSSSSSSTSTATSHGLDASAWPHNSMHALHGPFCVQDWCEVMHPSSIPSKLQYSNEHLIRSASCTAFIPGINTDPSNPVPPGPLHLNFLSGSNFFNRGTWPEKIAKVVNRGIEEWVCMGHFLEMPLSEPGAPGRASVEGVEDGEATRAVGVRRKAKVGDGGTGVVIMDNVGEGGDWDLVRLIVGMNMGVLLKMAEAEGHGKAVVGNGI